MTQLNDLEKEFINKYKKVRKSESIDNSIDEIRR